MILTTKRTKKHKEINHEAHEGTQRNLFNDLVILVRFVVNKNLKKLIC